MKKEDFHPDTRYTVTLLDAQGKPRPAKFYVLRLFAQEMVVRQTEREGMLKKIKYADIQKIIAHQAVSHQDRYTMPEALLNEKFWEGRNEMQHYATSPHMGK